MRWTDSQREAIEHGDGLLTVVAGAGSGKTGVLTERFVHLVAHHGVPPEHILTITFTRAATAEMKTRIIRKLEQRGLRDARTRIESAYIHTVHALCRRILQENPFEAGIDPEPSVLPAPAANHLKREAFHRALASLLRQPRDFETDPLIDLIADYLNLDAVRGDPLQALYELVQRVADATRHQGYTADDLERWRRTYPSAEALALHYVQNYLNPPPAGSSRKRGEPHGFGFPSRSGGNLTEGGESSVSLATLDDLRALTTHLQQTHPEAAFTLSSLLANFDPALERRARELACALLELTVEYLRAYEALNKHAAHSTSTICKSAPYNCCATAPPCADATSACSATRWSTKRRTSTACRRRLSTSCRRRAT
jgi:superfamily I DNA/RNA helicase